MIDDDDDNRTEQEREQDEEDEERQQREQRESDEQDAWERNHPDFNEDGDEIHYDDNDRPYVENNDDTRDYQD